MNNEIKEILDDLKNTGYEKLAKSIENIIDYITNLQQENEILKLELSGYREAILRDDKLLGLQQRIDKAIEYFSIFEGLDCVINGRMIEKGLNILRGEDNGN